MSKLDELIKKYCPDGVEYKRLQNVLTIKNGRDYKNLKCGDIPVYGSGGIMTHVDSYVYNKPSVLIPRKGSIDKLYYVDVPFWNVDTIFYTEINTKIVLPRYVFHCLLKEHLEKLNTAGGVPSLTQKVLNNVIIPVPPLPVQEEIVRILDSFTSLTAELQDKLNTEFQARKKQYEYYASNLFDKASIEWKSMGDIASFVYGYTDKAQDTGDTRFIRITDIDEQGHLKNEEPKYITINNEAKKSLLSYGDLIMARTGATYGKTLYFESEFPSVYASFLIKIIPNKNIILNKYYWHFTRTSFYWEQANRLVTTGGQPQFNTPAIKQIKIPVPSIDVQKQIINILDKFDSLINDLTTGLPAEIAARQKQYEYYRDKLLTFKELS